MIFLATSLEAAPLAPVQEFDGLPATAMASLTDCQDAYNELKTGRAQALASEVIAQWPQHPLPRIFLQGAMLVEIQEAAAGRAVEKTLYDRFKKASNEAVALAEERRRQQPGALADFYVGGSLGTRGLGAYYRRDFLGAYQDGKRADQALRQAVEEDPGLEDARLGLGQYRYFCGRMSGFLRILLGIQGDVKQGIALLEECAARGTFAASAARISLARIYCFDVIDFDKALPYVSETLSRFPGNYALVRAGMVEARGLGLDDPRAQALCDIILKQWDQGWRPPSYVSLDVENLRAELARVRESRGTAPHKEAGR